MGIGSLHWSRNLKLNAPLTQRGSAVMARLSPFRYEESMVLGGEMCRLSFETLFLDLEL